MRRKAENRLQLDRLSAPGPRPKAKGCKGRYLRAYNSRHMRRLVYGLLLCAVVAAVGHVAHGFFQDAPYFKLTHLKIDGLANPQLQMELKTLIETAIERNNSILSLDASELKRVIGSHPRIRDLELKKIYPDTLLISAAEREPAAVVSANSFYLIDWDSHVIEKVKAPNLRKYDLPYVTGVSPDEIQVGEMINNANVHKALDLIRAARERNKEFYARLSEVNVGADPISHLDSLTAHMKGGMEVRFGDKNPIEQLPAFDVYCDMMRKQSTDPYKMHYVDLRFKEQVVYMDEPTALAAAAGKLDELQQEEEKELNKLLKTAIPQKTPVSGRKITRATADDDVRERNAGDIRAQSGRRDEPARGSGSSPDPYGTLPRPSAVR